ncbi:DUF4124 domain-containing protein [Chitinimonas arctica]|uniref:DUF4124 domain-containing protein n=1 Tax=Chitinimonas arctica TaxID=2594795 RepID=A0A516SGE0_9NEIS|nr:DUF4124 domain-containing protein [Chitinimonas arctica]QDQ27226.1 DUF4124 domain-containing protein [Chitinimonas arctica]
MFRPLSLIVLLLTTPLAAQAGERLYKWVDENGKLQYSDKPPMQQTQKGVSELNKQGLTIRQTEGLLTPEQRIAREAELAKQREEAKTALDARRRDKALINSFTKTSEIDAIRDRNIEQLAAGIQSDQQRIEAINKRLAVYQRQVDKLTLAKRPISDDLKANIAERTGELAKINEHMQQQQQNIEQVRARAEADKKRLIELRGDSVQR